MARYIDADKAIILLNETQVEFDEYYKGLGRAKSLLMDMKTEDVAPVIHAKWLKDTTPYSETATSELCKCSNCMGVTWVHKVWGQPYCGHCGAKMGEER